MKHAPLIKQSKIESIPPAPEGKHWIIVADHKTAHIYKRTQKGIERVPDENACCSKNFPPDGSGKDDIFLRRLSRWLDAAEREGAFKQLVLIAPPVIVEEIRALLSDNVDMRVCKPMRGEVEKVTEDEIEDHLTEVVWL